MSDDAATIRRNRTKLLALFAIALVPLSLAFWLYQSARTGAPWGTTNRGQFMDPMVSVADLGIAPIDGKTSMVDSGHWWLIVAANDGCAAACQHAMHQLNQLHILLGRDAPRVQRGLVALGGTSIDAAVSRAYPQVALFGAPADALQPAVYIVDPLGNVVLRYSYDKSDKPVLDDLKQLLKVSHIG